MTGNLHSNATASTIAIYNMLQNHLMLLNKSATLLKKKQRCKGIYASYPSFKDDFHKITKQLEEEVFVMQENGCYLENYNRQPLKVI